jgi:hypothetical protein
LRKWICWFSDATFLTLGFSLATKALYYITLFHPSDRTDERKVVVQKSIVLDLGMISRAKERCIKVGRASSLIESKDTVSATNLHD